MPRFAFLAAACLVLGHAPAFGQSINIINHSFETPAIAPGTFSVGNSSVPADMTGWSVYNTGQTNSSRSFGVLNPANTTLYTQTPPDGTSNVGVVFLLNTTNIAEAGLRQTLASTFQLNTRYTLRVDVGNIGNDPNPPHNAFNFTGFPGYRIDLLAGGTLLASDNNTLLPGERQFLTSTVVFDPVAAHASAGQALEIRLVNLNGSGIEVNFDNVRLDAAAVPEPTGLLGLVAGAWLVRLATRRSASTG